VATRATSLRLPEQMAAEIAAVARTDGVPMSEAVRDAIEKHIAERRADEGFQERLKEILKEDEAVLKRLAEP
jgi:predicted DNA-binding protein